MSARMFMELEYKKSSSFGRGFANCTENFIYNTDKSYLFEIEDFKKTLEKILKTMQEQDRNNYFNMWLIIGEANEWGSEKSRKFVIYQTVDNRDNKVFEVTKYEAINSRDEVIINKRELKILIMEYWNQLAEK